MADPRTPGQVRSELVAERARLAEDKAALQAEARAALPYAVGGIAALALATKGRGLLRLLALARIWRYLRYLR